MMPGRVQQKQYYLQPRQPPFKADSPRKNWGAAGYGGGFFGQNSVSGTDD